MRIFDAKTDVRDLMLFHVLFCGAILFQFLFNFYDQYLFVLADPPKFSLLGESGPGLFPDLSVSWFLCVGLVFALCLSLSGLGFQPRALLVLATLCYFPYFGLIRQLGYVGEKTNLIPVFLLCLAASPEINQAGITHLRRKVRDPGSGSIVQAHAWPLLFARLAVCLVYLGAGLSKVRNAGFFWADGVTLQAYLLDHYLWDNIEAALFLAQFPVLCQFSMALTHIWELTFWFILFAPRLTRVYLVFGVLFHLMTEVTMHISYWKYFLPSYLAFVRFEDVRKLRMPKWTLRYGKRQMEHTNQF